MARVGLGYQDYEEVITEDIFYIDKTGFIKEWWENGDKVTLITRPRRFGKTLNMSTVECFFSNKYKNRGELFEGKEIWKYEKYRQLQGKYPVIFMSFASVKMGRTESIKAAVKQLISSLYTANRDIMQSQIFDDKDRKYFRSVTDNMADKTAIIAINRLSEFMERLYNEKVIILLDEYDTPMQEAWISGNWDGAVEFFRNFLNTTFKTNSHLNRGIITGITRISKESIFSDLNNLEVVTTTSTEYQTCFGFTEDEVFHTLDAMDLGKEKAGVKKWYDGFTFGMHTDIYNPWSIASFIKNKGRYEAYWSDTSGNGLVNSLIKTGNINIKQTMEDLIRGGSFQTKIDEQIVFDQLENDTNAVWSLFLATGYLKVLQLEKVIAGDLDAFEDDGEILYTLTITNLEVRKMFRKMIGGWFGGAAKSAYNDFIKALLSDDVDSMNEFMNYVALNSFSNFDTAQGVSKNDAPERFYHGFVLGLMVELSGRFRIKSNRESGFGRYDIMIVPIDKEKDNAYIIEFKVHKPQREKSLEETLANAHSQIEEKKYEAELISEGLAPEQIRKYGFAFKGKECLIG